MNKTRERIYLSAPHMSGAEMDQLAEAFRTNWIAPVGPHIDAFEQEFAAHVGAGGAVALSSGTAAIHLALMLLGVTPGDRVFCSSFTFVASANPILYLGAEPVFIDSEPESWNMSPQALERALMAAEFEGKLPRAVIVVHLYGQSAKMSEIRRICDHYGVPIVEDAAESLGATYQGQQTGTIGAFGIYSFNGNKIITTSGGGMLVSDDTDKLRIAKNWAAQAREPAPYYLHEEMGFNYRMSNLLAGVGRAQLRVLQDRVEARRAIYARYKEAFRPVDAIELMPELPGACPTHWLTAMTLHPSSAVRPMDIIQALESENIESRPVWKPLHTQPLFHGRAYYPHAENTHVAEDLFARGVCLPSGSSMTEDEQNRVIETVLRLFN